MSTTDSALLLSTSPYPTGSEWRRWDLHIHTPESKLGSPFGSVDWDGYVTALEAAVSAEEIAVIGVTDYMTIDGYEKLYRSKINDGRLPTGVLLIPNIEFRFMPMTGSGQALNVHLLVDPTAPDHVERIRRSLANLKVTYGPEQYGCDRADLIRFAKAQQPRLTDDQAYRFGIEQFKPSWERFSEWLGKEGWLRSNSLVGVANGKDGISGLPLSGFGATRDELLRLADFIFTGNPEDRIHYLGLKPGVSREEIIRMYGSLKPCVHGSDAHEVATLFKPEKDRKCWIKADPTFEGLRQILWEPGERVHIGATCPQPSDISKVIKSIAFSDHQNWFSQQSVDLNHGLVSVIGEKGTGKTAIADLIAMAAGIQPEKTSQASFVNKGKVHLNGVKVELEWGNGAVTQAVLPDKPFGAVTPLVRYLSQDFVEHLCSQDFDGDELQKEIEDVIFHKLSEEQKEGYSSFRELRAAREILSIARRDKYRGELATLNKEIARLQELLAERPKKEKARIEAEGQAEDLNKQVPEASKTVDQKVLLALDELQSKRKRLEDEVNAYSRRRRVIADAVSSYSELKTEVSARVALIQETLLQAGVPQATVARLPAQWDSTVIELLNAELSSIDQAIDKLRGKEDDADSAATLFGMAKGIARLQETVSQDEVSKKRLLDLQRLIQDRKTIAERIKNEIKDLDERVTDQLRKKQAQRTALYLKFFESLKDDEKGLRQLYEPMQKAIERIGANDQFSIAVGYSVNVGDWLSKSIRFYDNRKSGCEKMQEDIRRIVETELGPAWRSGSTEKINGAFATYSAQVNMPSFVVQYGTSKLTLVDVYDWMYSIDHVALTYKLQYSGIELEYLSPGTRGIALLVLYLLMDEDDTRPLLIDQPEGNLDSSSVYKQLVPYMRDAKKRRQIILITHNPNLVVATDSEQVVVATANRPTSQPYPCLSYSSGSLEHTKTNPDQGIREAVCLLLEGGKDAFRVREEQYALTR